MMKFKSSTLMLVLAAGLLGGVVYLTQRFVPPSTQTQQGQQLFTFEEDQVQALTITTPLRTLAVEKSPQGEWQMTQPETVPASAAAIAYLLNLMTTAQSDRPLTVPAERQEEFGLHQPLATINVMLTDGKPHQLVIGGYNFNRSALYALVDPPTDAAQPLSLVLVSPDFDNGVNRPLAEWKAESRPSPSPSP